MQKPSLILSVFVSVLLIGGALAAWILFLQKESEKAPDARDVSFLGEFSGSGGGGLGGMFGSSAGGGTPSSGEDISQTIPEFSKPTLTKIYNEPVSGLIPYDTTEDTATRVRFVDRAAGDILEYTRETNKTTRIVRETIPRVENAVFTKNGKKVFRQYRDEAGSLVTIETPLSSIQNESGIRSETLEAGTQHVIPLTNGSTVFFVKKTDGLHVLQKKDTDTKGLWKSSLSGWNVRTAGDRILITQNASYDIPSTSYVLDTKTAVLKNLGAVRGMVGILHESKPLVLFSRSGGNVTSLFIRDYENASEKALPVRTLASKCVWSKQKNNTLFCAIPNRMPSKDMPDTWYRGEVSFEDVWYAVDTETGGLTLLHDPKESGVSIDVEKPALNSAETALFFVNKTDQSLWMLSLPKEAQDAETE